MIRRSKNRDSCFCRVLLLCFAVLCRAQGPAPDPASQPLAAAHGGRTGSILVPMDSWVYAALDRLAAFGYITDQATGMRPWTRKECIRQINEAQKAIRAALESEGERESAAVRQGMRMLSDLHQEFAAEGQWSNYAELESLYARYTGISGKPLTDGYNFGQTLVNDYGRPYGQGSNAIAGMSAAAAVDRFSFYVRGESENAAPYSSPAAALSGKDHQIVPVLAGNGQTVNHVEPLEMYMGADFDNWSVTVGKQDLWWGPGQSGPLAFSTNAQPFYMFRVNSTAPLHLPGKLRVLGGFRVDLIGGELEGQSTPARPLMNGQKFTWQIYRDLELGFTRWSLFGGVDTAPLTVGTVLRNLTANSTTGRHDDPGDRKSDFDLMWHLPVPGRWVTLYADWYADDEPNPISSFHRSAASPGIYFARLPFLPSWDLRVEAPSTRIFGSDHGGEFFYWNLVYREANTNEGNLLGSWVGRDGRGLWAELSHWTSSRTRLAFAYRQNRIGSAFLPGGGTQEDGSISQTLQVTPQFNVQGMVQFERYDIPIMGPREQDFVASVQMVYTPKAALH